MGETRERKHNISMEVDHPVLWQIYAAVLGELVEERAVFVAGHELSASRLGSECHRPGSGAILHTHTHVIAQGLGPYFWAEPTSGLSAKTWARGPIFVGLALAGSAGSARDVHQAAVSPHAS